MRPTITPEFDQALRTVQHMVETRRLRQSLLLDGGAGTGKSTFINILRERYPEAVVAATTGIAATLVGGTTIHRLFNFPLKLIEPEIDRENSYPSPVLRKCRLLIVEEAGMLRADLVDGMDYYLRRATRRSAPFGGVAVVFVGDLYQLPPVVRGDDREILEKRLGYKSELCFDAKVWNTHELARYSFTRIFRQEENSFAELLNRTREGEPTADDIARINSRCGLEVPPNTTVLTPTRAQADAINAAALGKLSGSLFQAEARIKGDFKPEDAPVEPLLALKPGATVMLVSNGDAWRNGTTGIFRGVSGKDLIIDTHDGATVRVGKHSWDRNRFRWDENAKQIQHVKVGTLEQYPVRLAHGITIHKAQGQTLKRAVVDIGRGVFAPGMLYVSLSRVCALEGLYMHKQITAADCTAHQRVKEFFRGPAPEQAPVQMMRQNEQYSLGFVA